MVEEEKMGEVTSADTGLTPFEEHHYKKPPLNIVGGWQGVDSNVPPLPLDPASEDISQSKHDGGSEKEHEKMSFLDQLESRFPRWYHIALDVLLPLGFLIAVAFVCGHIVAVLELDGEKINNNLALAENQHLQELLKGLVDAAESAPVDCLDSYISSGGDMNNVLKLRQSLQECGSQLQVLDQPINDVYEELAIELGYGQYGSMSVNWMTCSNAKGREAGDQLAYMAGVWTESYETLLQENKDMSREEAMAQATGTNSCQVHTAAGAVFWFTIMTTIGYGNATPVTAGGRAMVYTLGFVSIILFTAIIGRAGYAVLQIVDDGLRRCERQKNKVVQKLGVIKRGVPSVLFWMALLILWILFVAEIAIWYNDARRVNSDLSLSDAMWWSYISTTTVGFGDFYIQPDVFLARDMFYIPLLLLISFVFLANFLLKLSGWLLEVMPSRESGSSLGLILEEQLELKSGNDHAQEAKHKASVQEEEGKEPPVSSPFKDESPAYLAETEIGLA
eukprot:CAMPEP_0198281060 /NCGR_PEP_ID=MMETSP1449-20131203/1070_1 /TAXON_ID=420275 /ORGANISM="Attheya septentrionalis, Strain CCMP2084" /LENGTH=504 /DNA_ID=CAMNT_0043976691 /DNA_START=143 /DNA_END=1657 /DNA_ORIENTATION=-